MAFILHIDSATENASVCISENEKLLALEESKIQKDHSSFLQPAIKKLLITTNHQPSEIDAIAVTAGPGSYTGLRVGLSSAKALCYALNKPLILLNTLEVMAQSQIENGEWKMEDILFCPMIDARRMEVFTAIYNKNLQPVLLPLAMILNENSFANLLDKNTIIFFGSGHQKLKNILHNSNAIFSNCKYNACNLIHLAYNAFIQHQFADLAYSEPFYLKEFFSSNFKK
ncbi:MAG: tRNA (adenosine(37)-N6)-threonylcarbamoyltransferase complex dimerization subunit type 1 TsaB [Chitinophagaceae bacterium]